MKEFDWTAESVVTLIKLYDEGLSYQQIMKAVGCSSRSMVAGKINRLRYSGAITSGPREPGGVRRKTPIQERKTPGVAHIPLIRQRHGEGKSDRQIADEIGIKPDDVRYLRKIEGLKANSQNSAKPTRVARAAGPAKECCRKPAAPHRPACARKSAVATESSLAALTKVREPITIIAAGCKTEEAFAEGFMGQRSRADIGELKPGVCRFPIDQPGGGVRFCADEAEPHQVYCGHHAARCYTTPGSRKPLKPSHVYAARR